MTSNEGWYEWTIMDKEPAQLTKAELEAVHGAAAVAHSERFRRVSTLYAHIVATAYDSDFERAALDSDEQVAATVAAWERSQGFDQCDWAAVGAEERDEVAEAVMGDRKGAL